MRALVDTHVMLWWMHDDPRLSLRVREILADPASELAWSVASSWEVAVKVAAGRLRLRRGLERFLAEILAGQELTLRGVTQADCLRFAGLPVHHRDPFDRMLVAQAQADGVSLLSIDEKLRAYDVDVVW